MKSWYEYQIILDQTQQKEIIMDSEKKILSNADEIRSWEIQSKWIMYRYICVWTYLNIRLCIFYYKQPYLSGVNWFYIITSIYYMYWNVKQQVGIYRNFEKLSVLLPLLLCLSQLQLVENCKREREREREASRPDSTFCVLKKRSLVRLALFIHVFSDMLKILVK